MAIPFVISVWFLFTTPPLTGATKVAYAAIMYIAAGIFYTGVSTPITSVFTKFNIKPRISHIS